MCIKNLGIEPVFLLSCGSFNPITVMHMRTMELARDKIEESHNPSKKENAQLSEIECTDKAVLNHAHRPVVVGGIFSPVSDLYGKKGLLPAAIRVELTRIACRTTSNWLSVSNWECCQPSWSRTREVLDYIQNSLEKIFSGLSKNNASDECNAISKSEILCTKDHPHSNDHLVIKEYEQVKITSLEGMATNCWLKNCLMNIVSSENYYQPECDKNQSHFDEYVNNNSSTALFNEEKTGYLLKNSSGTCLLSKPHIKLVCGSDVLQSFSVPNLWSDDDLETIVRDYGLICISRPSYDASKVIIESKILNRYKDNIKIVADGCQNSLSSTFVRRALSLGESVRYLVPERALEYIYAHKLYEAKGRTVGVCSQYS